jgi:hypothetical protein
MPRVEDLAGGEAGRFAVTPVVELSRDPHPVPGRGAVVVEIEGVLAQGRVCDEFLRDLRWSFLAGQPVAFAAEMVDSSYLERVLIDAFVLEEHAEGVDVTRYRVVLREYPEESGLAGGLLEGLGP